MNRREMISRSAIFGGLALVVGNTGFLLTGCTSEQVAAWVNLGLNLVATVLPTLPGIIGAVGALSGRTIPVDETTKITTIFGNVQSLFELVQTDLKAFEQNNDPTLVAKIKDVLSQIQTSLSTVLSNLHIEDQATIDHITASVNAFSLLAGDILAILPIVSGGKIQARKVSKKQMAQVTPQIWAAHFNDTVGKSTGHTDVDSVFANVKATVPVH